MSPDRRNTLLLLKRELTFLEQHYFGSAAGWKPKLFLQDSPLCPDFHVLGSPHPCTECGLIRFVPQESRRLPNACRYIPLNDGGQTLASLYRGATQEEIAAAVTGWLRRTIARMEGERQAELARGGRRR